MRAPPPVAVAQEPLGEQQGSLAGAISLVAGTTIGAGVLALPAKTIAAGFAPSALGLCCAWVYMSATALLIAEVNVNTLCALEKEAVSISSMASETLGEKSSIVTSAAYIFIHYALLVAYMLQGGTLMLELLPVMPPACLAAPTFAALVGGALVVGTPEQIERVNSVLVVGVIASFVALVAIGLPQVDPMLLSHADGAAVVPAIPLMVLALVFHNVVPTISNQLGCDLPRIRTAILVGSAIPTFMFVAWSAVILGSVPYEAASAASAAGEVFDPLQTLRAGGELFGSVVRVFSLLAVVTSFVGFTYGLTDFWADALGWTDGGAERAGGQEPADSGARAPSSGTARVDRGALELSSAGLRGDVAGIRSLPPPPVQKGVLYALTLGPPLAVAMSDPTLFFAALDNAGTYGILTLFGIIPAAMAWVQRYSDDAEPAVEAVLPGGRASLFAIAFAAASVIGLETWERLQGALGSVA